MSDRKGWIKLHRKIQDNPLWRERRKFSKAEAWVDILLEARHDPEPYRMIIGNKEIICNRGECIKSLDTWAGRWGWSKSAVRRFFVLLQNMNQIRHANETQTTRLAICNFETYNDTRNANETHVKRKRNACETHVKPNKNVKNVKNEKKSSPGPFKPPTLEEVKEHTAAKRLPVDPDAFWAYYNANGWRVGRNPMKSWQHALSYWARKEKQAGKPTAATRITLT